MTDMQFGYVVLCHPDQAVVGFPQILNLAKPTRISRSMDVAPHAFEVVPGNWTGT